MAFSGNDDPTIREYLLGRLSEEDREEFARRFFTDEELFEKLQAAEDDLIDDYLSGSLSQDDVAMFQQNFLVGSKRARELRIGKAWRNYAAAHAGEKPPKKEPASSWWQAFSPNAFKFGSVAALVVISTAVVWLAWPSEIDKGLKALNAAYKQERPLQSRITEFDYAPFGTTNTRGSALSTEKQNELDEAALRLRLVVNKKPTPVAHHAYGKVFLARKEFDKAIEHFEEALKGKPNDAQIHADLGAALLEKGKLEIDRARTETDSAESGKGVDYFARSLTNLNLALQTDPNLLEALYNRALLHELMKSLPQAEEDWRQYIEKDPGSEWANEARDRLAKIEQQRKQTSAIVEEISNRFLSQFNSGDEEGAWTTVSGFQNKTGNVVVEPLIDAYLRAATRNQKEDADWAIQRLNYVGDLHIRKTGDRFFFDLTQFYKSANSKQLELILQARERMKEGHAIWGQDYPESLRLFNKARELFAEAGDYPDTLVAEYWMSFSHHIKDKSQKQSRQTFAPFRSASENRHYLWLQVRAHYLLSSIEYKDNNHSKAVDSALQSAHLATRINDPVGLLNATISLIEYYRYLGSHAQSLNSVQRSLLLIIPGLESFQLIRYYTLAAKAFATFGRHDAAIGYQREAMRLALNTQSDLAKSQNYAFLGAIQGQLKNYDEALENVQRAYDLAQTRGVPDLMAYTALQMGNIYREAEDFDKAVDRYTQSINLYKTFPDFTTHLYHAHKGRFLCYLRQQNDHLAQEEVSILFDLINNYRRQISDEDSRNTFFDVEQTVVDAAIDFEYSRMNNPERAFDYSNSARARSLLDRLNADEGSVQDADKTFQKVAELRSLKMIEQQLPDQTQLVQYVVLENKLLIYVISRNNFRHKMQAISRQDLKEKLRTFLNLISRPPKHDESQEKLLAQELYAILIQPVENLLDKQKLLCVIADETLNYLPFAALLSPASNKYLFEDYRLMTSPSASVFLSCSENASRKVGPKEQNVLSVGNPTFDRAAFPALDDLPEATTEAVEVGKRYKSNVLLENRATVAAVKKHIEGSDLIHLALHSIVDDEVPLRSKLLLAKTKADTGISALYAYEIYNLRLPHTRLVVLSSCDSGAGRYYGGEGVSSIARAFISAGVPLVVASLWPVETAATENLMVNFHTHRTQEHISTVEALGKAQRQMARGADKNLRRPYYWAAFTVTGGYAEF